VPANQPAGVVEGVTWLSTAAGWYSGLLGLSVSQVMRQAGCGDQGTISELG